MRVTTAEARRAASRLRINLDVITLAAWRRAIQTELNEHGHVIAYSVFKAARIAADHLREFPDYYVRLERMERAARRYWSTRPRPRL